VNSSDLFNVDFFGRIIIVIEVDANEDTREAKLFIDVQPPSAILKQNVFNILNLIESSSSSRYEIEEKE
jgi:hypothetical protein